jgi:hypothetical protein
MNFKVNFDFLLVDSILDGLLILKSKTKFHSDKPSQNILPSVKASICSAKNAQAAAHDVNTPAISGILK